jgi:hypothetical protein
MIARLCGMMARYDHPRATPDWLPPGISDWVRDYGPVLDRIYAAFHGSGNWPDPVQLDRELRSQGVRLPVVAAVGEMPRELGWREWSPPRVRLTLLGLACVPGARSVLTRYVEVLYLALERYDEPEQESRLTRREMVQRLRLGTEEADRVSSLLVDDCPFLGGGMASVNAWNLEIDWRITTFEGVESVDDFLRRLADQRQISPRRRVEMSNTDRSPSPGPVQDTTANASSREIAREPEARGAVPAEATESGRQAAPHAVASSMIGAGAALLLVVAIGANLAGVLTAPWPGIVGVATAGLVAAVLHRWLLRPQPSLRAVGAVLAAGALAAGIAWVIGRNSDDNGGPRRYFVHPTEAPFLRRSEGPSRDARRLASAPLGDEDQVVVVCIARASDGSGPWAKLVDGTFVPLDQLVPEARSDRSPKNC